MRDKSVTEGKILFTKMVADLFKNSADSVAELLTLHTIVDRNGTIFYYNHNNEVHRVHGPAIIWKNGSIAWYRNGLKHRENGPASEYASGGKQWWEHGKLHRIDGPAVIYSDGNIEWWEYGKFIRRELS